MPRRPRIHVPGGFYHVTLRGNHQLPVFRCEADHGLLNLIVARAMETYDAQLHAYCWMSNHLHFLIQVGEEPLAGPMRQIAGEFARVMQGKMTTNGHFFQRRYHATLVEATDYLFTALHYIHRNPLEAGMVGDLDQHPWSSHHAYMGRRTETWLTTAYLLARFAPEPRAAFRAYEEFINTDRDEKALLFPEDAFVFGSDEFVNRIRGVDSKIEAENALRDLIAEACARFEVTRQQLVSPVRNRYLTKVRAWIAQQAGTRGISGRSEVARALGRSEGALRFAILKYPNEVE